MKHPPHILSSSTAPLASIVVALPLLLAACGPRVFEAGSAKVIEPSAPPVLAEAPEEPARVELTDDRIVIREKIQFDYNKATIKPESDSLLAEIAKVMNENPQVKKIRIEGHASSEGGHDYNVKLSKNRAKAVLDHLVKKGKVDKKRLESDGYGPDRPIASNETETGREANRRVEFMILEQEYTVTKKSVDPETGEEKIETEKKKD
jgi:outer membrane protein OmpA-like peptidoglycan-associated protein